MAGRMEITRRAFVSGGLATGTALMMSHALRPAAVLAAETFPWVETTIPELQALMATGQLTSRELTQAYLTRISALNPVLRAVIEANSDAVEDATRLDAERQTGRVRGALHGIPVVIKDNIATAGRQQTTAGSLALVGARVRTDATIVARLRAAGAVMLGKANLSEWANFRGFPSINGWSARGGFTRNPYLLSSDPCGSSSGPAVAAAASLCTAAVGTETDGSIVCPAGNNLVVGLKPTVGLVSQDGIIPLAHSQDTAGPIARTVTDAAILLAAIQTPFGDVLGHPVPPDYTPFLKRGALEGARIGVDQRYFTPQYGADMDLIRVVEPAMTVMGALGATLVPTDTGDVNAYFQSEVTALLFEFKVQIADYLATLEGVTMRTLADLIAFNDRNCQREMRYFGQELFLLSQSTSGNLADPLYRAARAHSRSAAGPNGIDAALQRDRLDAIIAPSYSFASTPAAVAGYPNISIPVGLSPEGKPAGIWMYSGFLREPHLLAFAYDLEQALQARRPPELLGEVPPDPADRGICSTLASRVQRFGDRADLPYHLGTGKLLGR